MAKLIKRNVEKIKRYCKRIRLGWKFRGKIEKTATIVVCLLYIAGTLYIIYWLLEFVVKLGQI